MRPLLAYPFPVSAAPVSRRPAKVTVCGMSAAVGAIERGRRPRRLCERELDVVDVRGQRGVREDDLTSAGERGRAGDRVHIVDGEIQRDVARAAGGDGYRWLRWRHDFAQ